MVKSDEEPLPIRDAALFEGMDFNPVAGRRTNYCGPPAARGILAPWDGELSYQNLLKGPGLIPLIQVSRGDAGERQVAGGFVTIGNGVCVLMPMPAEASYDRLSRYFATLAGLPDLLSARPRELPDWVNGFALQVEVRASAELGPVLN
jgi:hypothetical protein